MAASLPPTSRSVLALALPMTLAHVTTPLLGLVGAMVIGRLGEAALLGAMALGAVIFDAIFWSFGSLRMATAGLTAQAVGAHDRDDVDRTLARALAAAVLVGLVIVLAQVPIAALAFRISGASPEVLAALAAYFHVRIFAAPFTLANYAILGSVLGRGRTDLGLVIQVAINLANIALTLALVLGAGLGVTGAGIATLVAEVAGTGLGLFVLARLGSRPFRVPLAAIRDPLALARMLSVNADVMIRTLLLVGAIVLFSALGARAGDVTLAANAVLWNLFLVGGFFLDGFATAAETLCGQAVGARDETAFRRAARLSLAWCLVFGAAISGLFLLGGERFIDGVTTSPEVREAARLYLVPAALAPFVAGLPFAFDGIYIGATWTRAMRDLMLAATLVYAVLIVATWQAGGGNLGLWLAFLGLLGARGIGQALAYPGLVARTFGTPLAVRGDGSAPRRL
ncbi:MATE family efflux transporter [Methylobacterium sp. Leaf399]|uniref:MATE family efflux transporter n=1 Tax=Methylobacterium sp. Leaf399 TaxID=1736364 RepID=UPI0006FE6934|nr:MATE family efflux transporter [Methylobacterium sp. Leaf399]KQT08675.1 MATE family efflux transporter [Methylobacterium sp. Leaf399]